MKKSYWVYILECSDNSYYVGITNDIERRLSEHQLATDPGSYTSTRLPVFLAHEEVYSDPDSAIAREKQLKGWSRDKKKALIENNQNKIFLHSRRKGK